MNKTCNIGFVSTRFSGNDGVSLETKKWMQVLSNLGYPGFFFGADCDDTEREFQLYRPRSPFPAPGYPGYIPGRLFFASAPEGDHQAHPAVKRPSQAASVHLYQTIQYPSVDSGECPGNPSQYPTWDRADRIHRRDWHPGHCPPSRLLLGAQTLPGELCLGLSQYGVPASPAFHPPCGDQFVRIQPAQPAHRHFRHVDPQCDGFRPSPGACG